MNIFDSDNSLSVIIKDLAGKVVFKGNALPVSVIDKSKIYVRVYADKFDRNVITLRGSRCKEFLYDERLPTEYHAKGTLDERFIDKALMDIKPDEIYFDEDLLDRFSYGFYKKYRDVMEDGLNDN